MRMRPLYRVVIAGVVGAGMVSPAVAAVICTKKSGVMVVRDACKKKETQVNLADFGAVGPKGDPGQDLTVDTPLQGGQTETGVYSATGNVSGGFGLRHRVPPSPPRGHRRRQRRVQDRRCYRQHEPASERHAL